MATIGDLIREGRKAKGWSQRDLAEELEVSQSAVASWETTGEATGVKPIRPDISRFNDIALALDIDVRLLIDAAADNART